MELKRDIKLVYFVSGPLSQRWLDYYHIDEMAECFDVEFWDCSAIIANSYNVNNPILRPYVLTIKNIVDFEQHLKRLPKDTLAVIEIGLIEPYYPILRRIARYIKNGIQIDFWSYAPWAITEDKNRILINHIDDSSILKKIKDFLYQSDVIWFIAKLSKCRNFSQVKTLYTGLEKRKRMMKIQRKEKRCKSLFKIYEMTYKPSSLYTINHPDYEKYLQLRNREDRLDRYIVFIADAYPFHPERKISPDLDIEDIARRYYASLNKFFDKVEKAYGCKVVIAEHPSAHWDTNPFNGREIVYYKTAELVRDSIGVCIHISSAISYVALFNKPVAVIYTASMDADVDMGRYTYIMADSLGLGVYDMDTIEDVSDIFQPIDKETRALYIRTFADADSNIPNAQLMKQHFINIHNEIINH